MRWIKLYLPLWFSNCICLYDINYIRRKHAFSAWTARKRKRRDKWKIWMGCWTRRAHRWGEIPAKGKNDRGNRRLFSKWRLAQWQNSMETGGNTKTIWSIWSEWFNVRLFVNFHIQFLFLFQSSKKNATRLENETRLSGSEQDWEIGL